VTTRGMKEAEMQHIARWMDEVCAAPQDEARLARIADEVREVCTRFPAPGIRIA
jgi:glycine hydroxymethyltransferase